MTFQAEIEELSFALQEKQEAYLRRYGWELTCNTPSALWMWRRDFTSEDAVRHLRWKEAGPGPRGWPSEPKPYGVITATLEIALRMTMAVLDEEEQEMVEG